MPPSARSQVALQDPREDDPADGRHEREDHREVDEGLPAKRLRQQDQNRRRQTCGYLHRRQPRKRAGVEADRGAWDEANAEHRGAAQPLAHARRIGSRSAGLLAGWSWWTMSI